MLALVRAAGTRVVVDDFGIGYSSLDYVRRLPVSTIKIDKSFLADVAHSQHDQAIIKAIVTLAHSLDIEVVAEGIETAAQREFLLGLGVPLGQGFYYSRPLTAEHFAHLLTAKKNGESDESSGRVVSFYR